MMSLGFSWYKQVLSSLDDEEMRIALYINNQLAELNSTA